MPDHVKDPELFSQPYQVYAHSRTCCRFLYGQCFTEKTNIAKPLDSKLSNGAKKEVLIWRNTLLNQVKSYIDNNLHPEKVKMS